MTPRPQPPDELLSACHDGELTSAERAEVDRQLADNPALQETLDDFRELTSVLQSLPRPHAPPRLQAEVLRRVQAARPASAPPAARRFPWLWGLSLAAMAAMLMVLVWRNGPDTAVPELANASRASAAKDDAGPHDMSAESAAAPADGAADPAFGSSANSVAKTAPLPASPPVLAEPGSPARMSVPSEDVANGLGGSIPAAAPAAAASGLPSSAGESLASRLQFSHSEPPAVADVLAHVYESGGRTMVVEFDVLNVDQTSRDMLVLLRQRGVTMVSAAQDEAAPPAGTEPKLSVAADEQNLVAVYVEATEEQLASVVDDMLTRMAISDGVAFNTSLAGPELGQQFQRIEDLYGEGIETPSIVTARPMAAADEPPQAGAAAAFQAAEDRPARNETGDIAAAVESAPSRGVQLTISEQAYRQIETQNQLADKSVQSPPGMSGRAEELLQSRMAAAKSRGLSAAPMQPSTTADGQKESPDAGVRQMLIVLRSPIAK